MAPMLLHHEKVIVLNYPNDHDFLLNHVLAFLLNQILLDAVLVLIKILDQPKPFLVD